MNNIVQKPRIEYNKNQYYQHVQIIQYSEHHLYYRVLESVEFVAPVFGFLLIYQSGQKRFHVLIFHHYQLSVMQPPGARTHSLKLFVERVFADVPEGEGRIGDMSVTMAHVFAITGWTYCEKHSIELLSAVSYFDHIV